MAERLTDKQVADLQAILRSDALLDHKVQHVTNVKSAIKQHTVPETCIAQLFDGLRSASTSQHAALINAGFTALNHLLTRLSRQEPKYIAKEAARTLPVIIDKLGDQKDKYRSLASQALTTVYGFNPAEVERVVRTTAMSGKNPRAKEASLHWLLQMHQEHGLQFRSYVPLLMELLEDADGMVRDAAKSTVIELFRNAPNAAKSDLKRQLKNYKVRPAIEQAIVKALAPPSTRSETPTASAPPARSNLAASVSSIGSERPVTPAVGESSSDPVEPQYVNTNRELDDIFKGMAWEFDGKESEHNWQKREQGMTTLRRLNAGNAASDFQETFVAGLRSMLDGIIKALTSLRTSLSKEACALIEDIALSLGPAMEPMVELLMQSLVKMTAATKKIASQMANNTIDTIISRVTYTPRLMQHVWNACQDKNVQPRLYVTGWIKTLLKKVAGHKHHIEHTGGVDLIEKCIKKCLGDANPSVREKSRSTFWAFWAVWPARADAILADLDATAQKLLNKDPSNPNSPKKTETAARPASSLSRSTTASKPSLREAMLAQKRASAASKNLPARPGSAMAHISPVRTASNTSTQSTAAPAAKPPTRARPESIAVNAGGMSVAPMRPSRRRAEVARPATAGPYSVRDQPASMEDRSPESLKSKAPTPRVKDTTPKKPATKSRQGHARQVSDSSIPSPSSRHSAKPPASPIASPARPSPSKASPGKASPGKPSPGKPRMPGQDHHHLSSPPRPSPAKLSPHYRSPPKGDEGVTPIVPSMNSLESASTIVVDSQQDPEDIAATSPSPAPRVSLEPQPEKEQPEPQPEPTEPKAAQLQPEPGPESEQPAQPVQPEAEPQADAPSPQVQTQTQSQPLRVYEDPFTENQSTPKPNITVPVLEDKPVNEDAAKLNKANGQPPSSEEPESPEKTRQNSRLLDSGINKIKVMSLEVHGFRKLQSLIRDSRTVFTDDKFEALLLGLFKYLEDPLSSLSADKAQDIKAQILTTVKLLLRRERDNFQPHVSQGLEALLQTRSAYDARAHVVSGLELLADELVTIGDGSEMVVVLTRRLQAVSDASVPGCRTLSMGLHVLRELLERRADFVPSSAGAGCGEIEQLTALAAQCIESADSGVRMDAVKFCVALHAKLGEKVFWDALSGVKDDPKSLITYYIVKRQREEQASA